MGTVLAIVGVAAITTVVGAVVGTSIARRRGRQAESDAAARNEMTPITMNR